MRSSSVAEEINRWQREGPLVHRATGIASLDSATGGGPVYGSRWYVIGAPDACKTALLVQIAHEWSSDGTVVGILAIDEEPGDIVMRVVQRSVGGRDMGGRNFRRSDCETRDPGVLDEMRRATSGVSIVLYDSAWTIEAAALDVAKRATLAGQRAALMVDSIQTAECEAIREGELSIREQITANVRAVRAAATEHRMIVMATSEMNRSAYRTIDTSDVNDMASAKESGAIEYSARVMVSLRAVREEKDLIEARVIKNKHGSSHPALDPLFLRIDRARQVLSEVAPPLVEEIPGNGVSKEDAKAEARRASQEAREKEEAACAARRAEEKKQKWFARVSAEDSALFEVLTKSPGMTQDELVSALRVSLGGCSFAGALDAVERAKKAGWLEAVRGGPKNSTRHYISRAM